MVVLRCALVSGLFCDVVLAVVVPCFVVLWFFYFYFYFFYFFILLWTSGGGGGGGGGCGCGCDCDGRVIVVGAVNVFFSEIYYFIVVVILFYCDVYIILLC